MATSTINTDFLYEVHNISLPACSSGGAGVRAHIEDTNITRQGYTPVSATIGASLVGITERVDVMLFRTDGVDKLRCTVYHTYQAATQALTVPVRVLYIRNGT